MLRSTSSSSDCTAWYSTSAPLTFSTDWMMRSGRFLPVVASMNVGQPYCLCISPI